MAVGGIAVGVIPGRDGNTVAISSQNGSDGEWKGLFTKRIAAPAILTVPSVLPVEPPTIQFSCECGRGERARLRPHLRNRIVSPGRHKNKG